MRSQIGANRDRQATTFMEAARTTAAGGSFARPASLALSRIGHKFRFGNGRALGPLSSYIGDHS